MADLIGARNSTGLTYFNDSNVLYTYNKTVAYNSTRDELVYYFGSNNTFLKMNVTLHAWSLNT